MIDPTNITNFTRTESELEELLLFCIAVAGKTAKQIAISLEVFLHCVPSLPEESPFEKIRKMEKDGVLEDCIFNSKLGQWKKLSKSFSQLANSSLDLKNCSIEELEAIHGIGSKTSRFFLLHSRKSVLHAVLDTHILKYLKSLGFDVPKSTPNKKQYAEIEKTFLAHAKELNRDIAELDLEIWNSYARN